MKTYSNVARNILPICWLFISDLHFFLKYPWHVRININIISFEKKTAVINYKSPPTFNKITS